MSTATRLEVLSANTNGDELRIQLHQDKRLATNNINTNILVSFSVNISDIFRREGGPPLYMYTTKYNIENFLADMLEIQHNHANKAILLSDNDIIISIEPYNRRGYLLVRAHITYNSAGLPSEPSLENQFIVALVAEPAFLTVWIKRVQEFLQEVA